MVYLKDGDLMKALSQFQKAIEVNPLNSDAYNSAAYTYGELGEPQKELEFYKKAVEIEKDDPVYVYGLGRTLMDKFGDIETAEQFVSRAYEQSPLDYLYASDYGYLLAMLQRYDEALNIGDTLIKQYPRAGYGYSLKALCYYAMRNYDETVKWYLKSGEVSALSFKDAVVLASAYDLLHQYENAAAAYEYALRIKPHATEAMYALQCIYRKLGRYKEAFALVLEILRIDPRHSGAQYDSYS